MDELEELRYPWNGAVQFFGEGYFAELGALHLLLGWAFVFVLVWRVVRQHRLSVAFRFACLYFALTVYTNPAFNVAGLNLNEVFGVLAILSLLVEVRVPRLSDATPVTGAVFAVFVLGLAHLFVTQILYPELTPDPAVWFTKVAINLKVGVLAANLLIVGQSLRRQVGGSVLIKACLAAGTSGLCLYVLQLFILASGVMPYGTYLDAGFVGVPSFGSVSIERGHFGKFMAPYFPFFLFTLLAWRWRWRFYLLTLVTVINFSASSQVFFATFALLGLWCFRRRITPRVALLGFMVLGGTIAAVVYNYADVFASVFAKVYDIAIQGDESTGGGRSVGTFLEYLNAYPFGLGYSGSTLRTAPGLPEINAAHFAFVAQYSGLALPIAIGYLALVWLTLRLAWRGTLLARAMAIGVLMSMLIFAADILWFVPLIWLSFEIIWAEQRGVRMLPVRALAHAQN